MSRQKVLVISHEFPPRVGGAGTYTRELCVGLSRIGVQVTLVTCKHQSKHARMIDEELISKEHFRIIRMRSKGKLYFIMLPLYLRYYFGHNWEKLFDKIILADNRSIRFSTFAFTKEQMKKTSLVFHGGEVGAFHTKPNWMIRLTRINHQFTKSLKSCDKIITVSGSLKSEFLKHWPKLEKKIKVIYHGIDATIFNKISNEERKKIREKWGIEQNQIVILSASRLVPEKGQDMLIKAFTKLDSTDIKLVISGNGLHKATLFELASKNIPPNQFVFTGSLSREELGKLMAASDIFCLPSRANEGFGLVFIEAQACGIPVIGGSVGGVAEAVDDGKSGVLINPNAEDEIASAINRLLSKDVRSQFAESAFNRIQVNFTCEKMADNTLRILNE